MGVSFSCPLSSYIDIENGLESVLTNSIYSPGAVSLKTVETDATNPIDIKLEEARSPTSTAKSAFPDASNPKHEAATKLQKVYKSFRTRRKLADCAVLIQQSWWNVLEYVELENSSISFFNEGKHETAISRWSRARTRDSKVGKGLSKNGKARKLALQHWLEAIDPRHRYGHNLHFYYVKWLHSQSREPFFYWLDIGEGKEVNLVDKCPRPKLQQQCIKYLGPMERKEYEVSFEGEKLFYKQSGEPLCTTEDVKWIFVLSTSKILYVGIKKKGSFQHSSFLAGGAALAAGRLVVEDGILKAAWPHSGHYRPTAENFQDFLSFLEENDVDLTDVKLSPVDEGDCSFTRTGSVDDLAGKLDSSDMDTEDSTKERRDSEEKDTFGPHGPSRIRRFSETLTCLEIPKNDKSSFEMFETENPDLDSPTGGYGTTENAFALRHDSRIGSKMETIQMRKQLSGGPWTTGAGARIRCVRDHPSVVRTRALEHVNLSPRSSGILRSSCFSPRVARCA